MSCNLFREKFGECVVAFKIEMHVFIKQFVSWHPTRSESPQYPARINYRKLPGYRINPVVDAIIRPEAQSVAFLCHVEFKSCIFCLTGTQVAARQVVMEGGIVVISACHCRGILKRSERVRESPLSFQAHAVGEMVF